MNKAELIEAVADATDTSKAEASRTLDAVLDSIAGALSNGDKGKKQDLLKAIHFIEMIIERDYSETDI